MKSFTANSIRAALTASTLLICATAMSATEKPPIVLVHGAWETAAIWQGVEARLKTDGYRVTVVSLPGRPGAPETTGPVSLDLYRDAVISALKASKQPAVVVGHSFGGFPISAAADAAPERVRTLVYVAAYLPTNQQTLLELGNSDKESKIGPHLQVMKEKGIISVERGARADLFCNDCTPQIRAAISDAIVDEPLEPLVTPIHLAGERFALIDKVYIHTAKDQVVSPWLQVEMLKQTPVRLELTENTGHTPFLTDPNGLAKNIELAAVCRPDGAGGFVKVEMREDPC